MFIKKIFNRLFFLEEGDLFIANRYKNKKEEESIPMGHKIGPYIVIKKTLFNIYAVSCTSSKIDLYKLGNYNLRKDTFVNTRYIHKIKYKQFKDKLDVIDDNEYNYIKKLVYFKNRSSNISFIYSVGDIIKYYSNLYYIYKVLDNNYYLYPINKSDKSKYPVIINDKKYSFNYEGKKVISDSKYFRLIDTTNNINLINIRIKNSIFNKTNAKVIKRGSLINYNNIMYYIYGEESINWLVYNVNHDKNNKYKITINKNNFYTNFVIDVIKKCEDISIIMNASETEINNIRDYRKKVKKYI